MTMYARYTISSSSEPSAAPPSPPVRTCSAHTQPPLIIAPCTNPRKETQHLPPNDVHAPSHTLRSIYVYYSQYESLTVHISIDSTYSHNPANFLTGYQVSKPLRRYISRRWPRCRREPVVSSEIRRFELFVFINASKALFRNLTVTQHGQELACGADGVLPLAVYVSRFRCRWKSRINQHHIGRRNSDEAVRWLAFLGFFWTRFRIWNSRSTQNVFTLHDLIVTD